MENKKYEFYWQRTPEKWSLQTKYSLFFYFLFCLRGRRSLPLSMNVNLNCFFVNIH